MMYTDGAQCTANFVYTDGAGATSTSGTPRTAPAPAPSTDTNGCNTDSVPLGTKVDLHQRRQPRLARARRRPRHARLLLVAHRCSKLGDDRRRTPAPTTTWPWSRSTRPTSRKVNPSVPFWGGPTGIDTDGTAAGDDVYTYGNSSLRGGVAPLSPHAGRQPRRRPGRRRLVAPALHRDPRHPRRLRLGLHERGRQGVGVLSTLGLAPLPASNNIGDLAKELAFAQANSGFSGLQLVNGTEPFAPIL